MPVPTGIARSAEEEDSLPQHNPALALTWDVDFALPFYSRLSMDEAFKIVKVQGATDEVLARIDNYEVCKAAFEKALFVYPQEHLELRQGARIILKSKEPHTGHNRVKDTT